MKKILAVLLGSVLVLPMLVSCGGEKPKEEAQEHQHSYRIVEQEATCTEDGYTEYICDCGHSYKENIVKAKGHDYQTKDNSLFLGSSIFYGHLKGNSFVDMMSEDYLTLEQNGKTSYLKRNKELEESGNFGESQVYRCDELLVSVNREQTQGRFGNQKVTFEKDGDSLKIKENGAKITLHAGDKQVYKLAANGASMAYFTPQELKPQGDEYEHRSYWYRLTEYGKDIEKVDHFYLQLSTNDAAWKTKGDVEFGEILPDNKRELEDFDYTTSFGAMEYMIAWARKQWDCRVTIVVCPYITMSGDYGRFYSQLVEKVPELQRKWNVGVLDLYHDEEIYNNVTSKDKEWLDRYMYPDRVHLTDLGYEAWILPKVRAYVDSEGWQKDANGKEFRICGRCGEKETR